MMERSCLARLVFCLFCFAFGTQIITVNKCSLMLLSCSHSGFLMLYFSTALEGFLSIELFAISRKGMERARPILTALATVEIRGISSRLSVAFACKLELSSIYLHFFESYTTIVYHDKCFLWIIQPSGNPFNHW